VTVPSSFDGIECKVAFTKDWIEVGTWPKKWSRQRDIEDSSLLRIPGGLVAFSSYWLSDHENNAEPICQYQKSLALRCCLVSFHRDL
jgi:hypothetical protein